MFALFLGLVGIVSWCVWTIASVVVRNRREDVHRMNRVVPHAVPVPAAARAAPETGSRILNPSTELRNWRAYDVPTYQRRGVSPAQFQEAPPGLHHIVPSAHGDSWSR